MLKKASAQRYQTNRRTPIEERKNAQVKENQANNSQIGRNSYGALNQNVKQSQTQLQRQNSGKNKTRNNHSEKMFLSQHNETSEAYMLQSNIPKPTILKNQGNHTYNSQQNMVQALNASQNLYEQIKSKNQGLPSHTQLVPLSEQQSSAKIQTDIRKGNKPIAQSHQKKPSKEVFNSHRNSQKQSVEGFFNQRNTNSRESLRHAIKTYKEGIDQNQSRNGETQKIYKGSRHRSQPRVTNQMFQYENTQTKIKANYRDFNLLSSNNKKQFMNMTEAIPFEQPSTQNITQVLNSSDFVVTEPVNQSFTYNHYSNQPPLYDTKRSLSRQQKTTTNIRKCTCQCPQHQETTSQTTRMMSILSTGPNNVRNTLTLRIGPSAITHSEAHTTALPVEEPMENSDLEEMHYLMVHVEKMKKQMLGRIEKTQDPQLEYPLDDNFDKSEEQTRNLNVILLQ